jgi:Flp pilus assembly protein TadG
MPARVVSRREEGAVAVEFALIFTILLILLFAIISFGLTYSRYQVLIGAAREGARAAAVGDTQAMAQDAIDNAAPQSQYPHPDAAWTLSESSAGDPPCTADTAGEQVEASWNQTFTIDVLFLPVFNPTVTFRGVFRCE